MLISSLLLLPLVLALVAPSARCSLAWIPDASMAAPDLEDGDNWRASGIYLDLTRLLISASLRATPPTASVDAVAASLRRFLPAVPPTVRLAAPVSRPIGGRRVRRLPKRLTLAVAVRPDSQSGSLLAMRGPAADGSPLLLGLRYSMQAVGSDRPSVQLEIRLAGRLAGRFEQRLQPSFRLGDSWLVFHVHFVPGQMRMQFWCPGHQFWSDSDSNEVSLPLETSLNTVSLRPGSALHLLHDGLGDEFKGFVHRLALQSAVNSNRDRTRLKCSPRLPRRTPSRKRQARSPSPQDPDGEISSSGGDEPPPPPASTPMPTRAPPVEDPSGPDDDDEDDEDNSTPAQLTTTAGRAMTPTPVPTPTSTPTTSPTPTTTPTPKFTPQVGKNDAMDFATPASIPTRTPTATPDLTPTDFDENEDFVTPPPTRPSTLGPYDPFVDYDLTVLPTSQLPTASTPTPKFTPLTKTNGNNENGFAGMPTSIPTRTPTATPDLTPTDFDEDEEFVTPPPTRPSTLGPYDQFVDYDLTVLPTTPSSSQQDNLRSGGNIPQHPSAKAILVSDVSPSGASSEIPSEGSSMESGGATTLGSNCQLISGKTVCNYQGTLMLTQLLLNITSTPPSTTDGVSSMVRRQTDRPSVEKSDTDQHVDLVDDLSAFVKPTPRKGSGSRSAGGGFVQLPSLSPRSTYARIPVTQSIQEVATTPSAEKLLATPAIYRGDKGEAGAPGTPGLCPKPCLEAEVLSIPAGPGTKGAIGAQGAQGAKGEPGSPGQPGKDGALGPPGQCRLDQCGKGVKGDMGVVGPPGVDGVKGEQGTRGDPGPIGEKGEPGALDSFAVRGLVRSEMQQMIRGLKGDRGEPGFVSGETPAPKGATRGPGVIGSTSVRVLKTYKALIEIGYAFEEGTLVFTKDEQILYLKTDYRINQWIEVANYISKPKIQLGFPATTTSPRSGFGPQIFRPYLVTGRKIRLVALPIKLNGDLYYKSAYSILGADYACHDAAISAGLHKSYFKVFLNGQFNNLDTIVHASQRNDVPIVNFHGQKLFSSFADMISRGAWNTEVQLQDFGGRNLSEWSEFHGRSEILAWQGLRQWQRQANLFSQDCEGFTNRDPSKMGYVTDLASGQLFQSREITCDSQQLVLCIEAFEENSTIADPMDYRVRR